MFWVDFLFQIVKVTIDGQLKFWWLRGSLSNRRSNSSFLINNLLYQKMMITKEVEKRWPRRSALPIYRNKADAIQIDKFVAKLVKDDTRLFPEFGCGKEAVLETVLNKIREQRRQQKEKYLTSKEGLSTDSASESTESAESSCWSPIPPTYTYQMQRVQKAYNLYFEEDVEITEVITANNWLPVFFLDLENQKLYLKVKVACDKIKQG